MMAAEAPEPKRARAAPQQLTVDDSDEEVPVPQPPKAIDKVVVLKVICQTSGSWRRIEILQSQTLKDLHAIIFKAFDRDDEHCYKFTSPEGDNYIRFCLLHSNGSYDPISSCLMFARQDHSIQVAQFGPGFSMARVRAALEDMPKTYSLAPFHKPKENPALDALNLKPDDTMTYLFDFGDQWDHLIIVEAVGADPEASGVYPRIVGGFGQSKPQYSYLQAKDPLIISPEATQPFTAAERAEAEQYRQREPREVWSAMRRDFMVPTAPQWGDDEEKALALLIRAGVKFSDAWAQYLEPALLLRNKNAASGRYTQMKKRVVASTDAHEKERKLKAAIGLLRMHREIILRRTKVEDRALSAPEPEYATPIQTDDLFKLMMEKKGEDDF